MLHRRATPDDNRAILAFMAGEDMQAGLRLRFDRSPDFFGLSRAHGECFETHLLERAGEIVALASLVVRDGYLGGVRRRVIYLCDLRVRPDRRLAGRWRRPFVERMTALAAETGARHAYTAVLRDNHRARNALLTRGRLGFRPLRGFSTVMVLGRKPWRRRGRASVRVRRAGSGDFEALRSFLDEDSRARPFGTVFDEAAFEERLRSWPNLALDRFLLALDRGGRIVGCLAPWDYAPLKRVVIEALPPSSELVRRGFNLIAPLVARPPIGRPPGAVLPDIALSHLAVRERDPATLSALLERAVGNVARERRFATVSLCLFDDDPSWPALDGFWHHDVALDLYTLPIGGASGAETFGDTVPGFEFYLA